MMNNAFKPKTYQDWLNEINFSVNEHQMINAALNAGNLAADKNAARHDIALVLAHKYKTEMKRTANRTMLVDSINKKYEAVAQTVFKSKFNALLSYVMKNEPNFDIEHKNKAEGKTPLGFVNAGETVDEKGNPRSPLGFVKKPTPRMGVSARPGSSEVEERSEPGLGFLGTD